MVNLVQQSINTFIKNHPKYGPTVESNDEVDLYSEEMPMEYEPTNGSLSAGPLSSWRQTTLMEPFGGRKRIKPNETPICFCYNIFYYPQTALRVTTTRGWTNFEETPENVKKVIFTIQNILSSAIKIKNGLAKFDTAYLKNLDEQAYQSFWNKTCEDYAKLIPFTKVRENLKEAAIGTVLDIPANYYPVIPGIYKGYDIGEKLVWKSEASKAPIVVQVHAIHDLETTVITGYDQENQPILTKLSAATLVKEIVFREAESKEKM